MYTSHINILRTCFESWSCLYHASISLSDATDIMMLLHGVIHVETTLCDAASEASRRFMLDRNNALTIISRFHHFLFSPSHISEGPSTRLLVEVPQLLYLWFSVVDNWVKSLLQQPKEFLVKEEQTIMTRLREIESGAVFLMVHEQWPIHSSGVKIICWLGELLSQLAPYQSSHSRVLSGKALRQILPAQFQ